MSDKPAKYSFLQIGKDSLPKVQYWMYTEETMRKRALESLFGNGLRSLKVDKKRISPVHTKVLKHFGYLKPVYNLPVLLVKEQALKDWEEKYEPRRKDEIPPSTEAS